MVDVLSVCIAVLALLVIGLIFSKVRKYRIEKMVHKLPGPDYNFLLGNATQLMVAREDMFANMQAIVKPYVEKGICRIWIGSKAMIFLLTAEAAEVLLSNSRFLTKSFEYSFLQPWLGTGLITSTGTKWHAHRKLITPTFHFRILESFINVFNEQASTLVSILKDHIGKEPIDVYPYLTRCTLDVICETAMGRSINAQRDTTSEYLTAVNDVSEILTYRILSPLLQHDILFWLSPLGRRQRKSLRVIHGFANKIIKEKREEIEKGLSSEQPTEQPEVFGQKRRMAFLDLLLQSKGLSNEDIREEVDTFMFAGHDTTASTMAWTLFNIGRFPEVQRLVHEELDRVIGRDERPIMTEEIRELKYLECVIKESLRVIPVVANYSRLITEDVEICGYTVPAGSEANVNVYTIHRDPKHFPDPDKFDPERFLPEISSGRHPYAYIPFSAGPRNCVGQKFGLLEDKVMISNILRQFKVTSMQKMEDMRILNEIVLRPANGLWLKFESRDEN